MKRPQFDIERYRTSPAAFCDDFVQFSEKRQRWTLSAHQRRVLDLAFRWSPAGRLLVKLLLWNGDRTSPLPSSRHMYYVQKGWTAVSIADDPTPARTEDVNGPADIAEAARHDKAAHYRRGDDESIFSTRQHASLVAKGWSFVGLADEARLRAYAEKRPRPPDVIEQTEGPNATRVETSRPTKK